MRPTVDTLTTVGEGGQRNFLHPAQARGRFTRLRSVTQAVLVSILVALPFIQIGGQPAVLLDVAHRRFFFFGLTFGPTDTYLLFFLFTGIGFSLIVASALWGRVWCGYACPQTVFLEGVYRRIERWVDKITHNPIARAVVRNALYIVVSTLLAHVVTAYFIGASQFAKLIAGGPAADPGLFIWIVVATGIVYFNFAWFREQLCIIICPYGRLQSTLSDDDTIQIGYDSRRGEPRGKKGQATGDCVDCGRCISVCPTGIDIRQGFQLECVGCAGCIDVCDEVMVKIGRPTGLIRYDSERGLRGEKRRLWRPHLVFFSGLALAGIIAFTAVASTRRAFPVNLLRQPGAPFSLDGDVVQNAFAVSAHNKTLASETLQVRVTAPGEVVLPRAEVTLAPGADVKLPLFVRFKRGTRGHVQVDVTNEHGATVAMDAELIGPAQ